MITERIKLYRCRYCAKPYRRKWALDRHEGWCKCFRCEWFYKGETDPVYGEYWIGAGCEESHHEEDEVFNGPQPMECPDRKPRDWSYSYRCEYCRKSFWSEKVAKRHESCCQCRGCKHSIEETGSVEDYFSILAKYCDRDHWTVDLSDGFNYKGEPPGHPCPDRAVRVLMDSFSPGSTPAPTGATGPVEGSDAEIGGDVLVGNGNETKGGRE